MMLRCSPRDHCCNMSVSFVMLSAVDPAVDNDGRMSDDNRATACPNAASPNHSTRADYCARFSSTQGDDAT